MQDSLPEQCGLSDIEPHADTLLPRPAHWHLWPLWNAHNRRFHRFPHINKWVTNNQNVSTFDTEALSEAICLPRLLRTRNHVIEENAKTPLVARAKVGDGADKVVHTVHGLNHNPDMA